MTTATAKRGPGHPVSADPVAKWPTISFHVRPEELRFIEEAAFKRGKKRAHYVREALLRDAARTLQRKVPTPATEPD